MAPAFSEPIRPHWSLVVSAAVGLGALVIALRRRWHVISLEPLRPPATWAVAALALLAAMLLLPALGRALARWLLGVSTGQTAGLSLATQARLMLGMYAAQAIAVMAFWHVRDALWPDALAPRHRLGPGRSTLIALATLALIYPLVIAAAESAALLTWWLTGVKPGPLAHDMLKTLAESPVDAWLVMIVTLIIVAGPVCEEVMYRGLVQNLLKHAGMSRRWSIAGASAVFVAAHLTAVPAHALPGLFILSLGLGWSYEKTGRLLAPIIMHALFNALNIAQLFLAPGAPGCDCRVPWRRRSRARGNPVSVHLAGRLDSRMRGNDGHGHARE